MKESIGLKASTGESMGYIAETCKYYFISNNTEHYYMTFDTIKDMKIYIHLHHTMTGEIINLIEKLK